MSWHAPTPSVDLIINMIKRELETDTNWDNVDIRIEMFEEAGGYDTTEAKAPFQIFTRLLGVNKGHSKWKTIESRYREARRQHERELRDRGLSLRAIGKKVGVSKSQVEKDLSTHDKKGGQPRRVYQVSNYTKPETAAAKLLDKFGHGWCSDLVVALKGQLERGNDGQG
jgi:hypothetical protein